MHRIIWSILVVCFVLTAVTVLYVNKYKKTPEIDKVQVSRLLPEYDLEALTNDAELIVSGVVGKISQPKWNNKDDKKPNPLTGSDTIYADVTISVNDVIKETEPCGDVVEVRVFEGIADDFMVEDSSQPKFNTGDVVTVFLINDNTLYNKNKTADHFIILGGVQGAFKLGKDELGNGNEKFEASEFKRKIQKYLQNPKPKTNVISEE